MEKGANIVCVRSILGTLHMLTFHSQVNPMIFIPLFSLATEVQRASTFHKRMQVSLTLSNFKVLLFQL